MYATWYSESQSSERTVQVHGTTRNILLCILPVVVHVFAVTTSAFDPVVNYSTTAHKNGLEPIKKFKWCNFHLAYKQNAQF
jgi:hypothetical protein